MERPTITDELAASSHVRTRKTKASQAAETIKQRIKQGVYQTGDQLPSIRTLSSEFDLTLPVIQRAVRQLELEGILESQHGVGIRILDSADCRATPLLFGFVQPYFSHFSLALQHYLEDALDSRSNLCVMKSTHNKPGRERTQIEKLINSGVNGLLIWPVDGDTNGPFLQEIAQKLPVVFVDRTIDGVRAPSVVLAYEEVGREIVRALLKKGCQNILVVCDPANISSFNQLKMGMREEEKRQNAVGVLTFLNQDIIQLIESAYQGEYERADRCYQSLAPILMPGEFDAIFSPNSEFFDLVFAYGDRALTLGNMERVTLRTPEGPPHSRRYYQLGMDEWRIDTAKMIVLALDLLQDMSLSRTPKIRTLQVKIERIQSSPSA